MKQSCYFADVFCGVGHVGLSVSQLGFNSRQWDTTLDPALDVTREEVLSRLLDDILGGKGTGLLSSDSMYELLGGPHPHMSPAVQ